MRISSRALCRALLLVLLVAVLACQSDEEKLAEHMQRGDAYREAEEYPESIIEYKSALQIDPNLAAAHWGLAQSYLANNLPREGYWELRETSRLDPSNIEATIEFARLSILAGEPEEAKSKAENVIALEPENVTAYLILGQAHEALKKSKPARKAYEKAVELGLDHEDADAALLRLAVFYNQNNRRKEAEPLFKKLTEHNPNFVNHIALASFLLQFRERYEEVEEVYLKSVEVAEPEELEKAYGILAGFYYRTDRFDEAVSVLRQGIEELDEALDLIYLLARFYNMNGENAKADALIEEATTAAPDDERPHMILSTYRSRHGDLEGALEAVERVLEINPDNTEGQLRKAELLVDIGFKGKDNEMIDQGRTLIDMMLENNPTDAGALAVLAKIQLAKKDTKGALLSLHQALDSRPDWAQAHFLLGAALGLQGDKTAARSELARALELDAGLVEARKILAKIHQSLGEHEYAVEEGRRYLVEHPRDSATRVIVAQSLLNLGRRTESLRELEAMPAGGRNSKVLYALGTLNMMLGRFETARVNLMAALEIAPTNFDLLKAMLNLDAREGRVKDSVKRLALALESAPDNGKLWQLNGVLELSRGRGEEAEKSFKKAIELTPGDLSGYERLATFYGRTGRSQQAIEIYEKAVAVKPDRAKLHYMLGVLYEGLGQSDKAIVSYEEAIRRGPELGQAKNNLAYIYADSGQNLDRALDLAQEAKALLPDNPNAADTMGWVLYKRGIPSAAISFLKEAESGIPHTDVNRGVVRHHLALAYEANEEPDKAIEIIDNALKELGEMVEEAKSKNREFGAEPSWAANMRAMKERLNKPSEG